MVSLDDDASAPVGEPAPGSSDPIIEGSPSHIEQESPSGEAAVEGGPGTPEGEAADEQDEAPEVDEREVRSHRLDRTLSTALWVVGVLVVVFAAFFGYSVYAQNLADQATNPALQVISALQKQIAASPKDSTLYVRLAEGYAADGQFDAAKTQIANALRLNPTYVGAYQDLASIEQLQGDYGPAIAAWNKVLTLTAAAGMDNVNQRRDEAYFSLGQIALVQKNYTEAVGYFNAAIRVRNDASDTYLYLAKAYTGLGQPDNALKQLNIALAFDPKYPEAHYDRGRIYLAKGDKVDAAWDFRAALDGAPGQTEAQSALDGLGTVTTWLDQANSAFASHDASQALDAARVARAIDPQSYDAAMLQGRILESVNDGADAVDPYTVALKIKPGDPAATAGLKRAKAAAALAASKPKTSSTKGSST